MKNLTKTEKLIIDKIAGEEFILTVHAIERMKERQVSALDIINVAEIATSIKW